MDTQLEVVFCGDTGRFPNDIGGGGVQPRAGREVIVGLQEPGAVGAQSSVDETLDGTNGEVIVSVSDPPVVLDAFFQVPDLG